MKKGELGLFIFLFVVFFSFLSSAASCSSDSQIIFSLFSEDNSHVSSYNYDSYPVKACYDSIFGNSGNGDRICKEDGSNVLFYKLSENNSHISAIKDANYNIPVCYGDLSCELVDSSSSSCSSDQIILASLYSLHNSHISLGDNPSYPFKICCTPSNQEGGNYINLSKISNVFWSKYSSLESVSSVSNGTYVNLSIDGNFSAGQKFDYNIYLKKYFLGINHANSLVSSGTHTITSEEALNNVSSSVSWFATWEQSGVGDSRYYFSILDSSVSKSSEILSVSSGASNSPTKVKITNPLEGQSYLIGDLINLSWQVTELNNPIYKIRILGGVGANINNLGKNEETFEGTQSELLGLKLNLTYSSGGQKEIILFATDAVGNVDESRVNILVLKEGLNVYSKISSPEHLSNPLIDSNGRIQFSALGSYVVNKSGNSYSCALGNCPSKTSGLNSVLISNSLNSSQKQLVSKDALFNWSGNGIGTTIYGTGADQNITVFSKFQSVGYEKQISLSFSYLGINSQVTNLYNIIYSNLLCNYEIGSWVQGANTFSNSSISCYDEESEKTCCPGFTECSITSGTCNPTTKYLCYQYNSSKQECEGASASVANYTLYNSGKNYYSGLVLFRNGSCIELIQDVECTWNSSLNSCGVSYSIDQDGVCGSSTSGTVGTCVITPSENSDNCDDGFLTYSWTANWVSGNSNSLSSSDESLNCKSDSSKIACPAELQVPYFGTFGVILVLILVVAIYYILRKTKFFSSSKFKPSKNKKSSKGKNRK